jgi:hypothetical protein
MADCFTACRINISHEIDVDKNVHHLRRYCVLRNDIFVRGGMWYAVLVIVVSWSLFLLLYILYFDLFCLYKAFIVGSL